VRRFMQGFCWTGQNCSFPVEAISRQKPWYVNSDTSDGSAYTKTGDTLKKLSGRYLGHGKNG